MTDLKSLKAPEVRFRQEQERQTGFNKATAAPGVDPTPEEAIGTLAGSITGGLAETAPPVLMAFELGLAGVALGGGPTPAGAVFGTLGAGAGLLIGHFAGKDLRALLVEQGLALPAPEEQPEKFRPYAYTGELVGVGVPLVGAPLIAAQRGMEFPATKVGTFVNRVIQTAKDKPVRFAGVEGAALVSAGIGGGVAETFFPGRPGVRLGAEVVGGAANPTRLVVSATNFGLSKGATVIKSMRVEGRMEKAAEILQTAVAVAGKEPNQVAAAIRTALIEIEKLGLPELKKLTTAQLTGERAMAALEAKLISSSAKFSVEEATRAESGLEALKQLTLMYTGIGTPAALKAAALSRRAYFRTLIQSRVDNAVDKLADLSNKLDPGQRAVSRSLISAHAEGLLDDVFKEIRKVESQLWDKVPQADLAGAETFMLQYTRARSQMMVDEKLPPIVENFVKRREKALAGEEGIDEAGELFTIREPVGEDEVTTVGELVIFRRRLLQLSREATGADKPDDARILGELAEGILDDLDPPEGVSPFGEAIVEYRAARQFSRELNDTFTSTFAGEATRTTARGAPRIPPELMMKRALGPGGELTALRTQQMQRAAGFLRDKRLEGPERFEAMVDLQENFFRAMAFESIDIRTGKASIAQIKRFLKSQKEVLDQFPAVRRDAEAVLTSQERLNDIERLAKQQVKIIENQAAFTRVSGFESPVDAVANVLRTGEKEPVKALTALVRLAKRGAPNRNVSPEQSIDGLKASIWQNALRDSADEVTGVLSFSKLRAKMFEPIRPGADSVMGVLEKQGVVSQAEVAQVKRILKAADNIATKTTLPISPAELAELDIGLFDLVVRVTGSKLGKEMSALGGGGSTLIAQGAGVRYFRTLAEKVPQENIRKYLIEAMMNPKFAATLLEKTKTAKKGIQNALVGWSFLLAAGLTVDGLEEGPER